MEHLTRDEQPPSWMWPFESELEIWFDEVDKQREERFGGSGRSDNSSSDDGFIQNELAKGRGR